MEMKQIVLLLVLFGTVAVDKPAVNRFSFTSGPLIVDRAGTNDVGLLFCCGGPVCFPGEPCGIRKQVG
jgi:hypothetical protein